MGPSADGKERALMGVFWSKFVAGVKWLWAKAKAFVAFVADFVAWLKERGKAE